MATRVAEIAEAVAPIGLQESKVRVQRCFEYVLAAIDNAYFLAGREFGPNGGPRVKAAKPGAGRADTLDQRSLRHQFQFRFAFDIALTKARSRWIIGKRGHQLTDAPILDQSTQGKVVEPRPVMDDNQIGRPALPEGLDQLTGYAGVAEPADHDVGAIEHIRYRCGTGSDSLVGHDSTPSTSAPIKPDIKALDANIPVVRRSFPRS
jgi:hypothetical protein